MKIDKIKEIALEYEWECEICEKNKNLVNHHVSYFPEEIIVLCNKCHTILHKTTNRDQCELLPDMKRSTWKKIKRLFKYSNRYNELRPLLGTWRKMELIDMYKDPSDIKEKYDTFSCTEENRLKVAHEKELL